MLVFQGGISSARDFTSLTAEQGVRSHLGYLIDASACGTGFTRGMARAAVDSRSQVDLRARRRAG
jgi:hypothetical protein